MTAAAITPSVVCKQNTLPVMDTITGTAPSFTEYYIELTKVTQNDWILLETAIGDTTKEIANVTGIVLDSSSDLTQETFTYDDSEDKLVLTAAGVGTCKIWIKMENA